MFSVHDLLECIGEPWFRESYQTCERIMLLHRLGLPCSVGEASISYDALRFSQAVLASAPDWSNEPILGAERLLSYAGDIESAFALIAEMLGRHESASLHLLHASVLYDLASLPGTASSQARRNGMFPSVQQFFSRSPGTFWGQLQEEAMIDDADVEDEISRGVDDSTFQTVNRAIGESLFDFGQQLQQFLDDVPARGETDLALIRAVSSNYNTEVTSDLINALGSAVNRRFNNSLLRVLPKYSSLPLAWLRRLKVPSELWPAQLEALKHGMLDTNVTAFGLAAPTGTGKTASTRILLADFLSRNPQSAALYVVPTRALAAQVTVDLAASLSSIDLHVMSLGGHLTLVEQLGTSTDDAHVIVFTPEKADLLLRVDEELLARVGLVIVDEAHHIEQGTRGVLLEFYLWRLRRLLPDTARIVQLSAVAPNIRELVDWLAPTTQTSFAKLDWRANRLRLGIFERTRNGRGLVQFHDESPFEVFPSGTCPKDREQNIAQLALSLSSRGVILVLTTSKAKAERLAALIAEMRDNIPEPTGDGVERLDSRIERELYPECPLRNITKYRVAYHHSSLPPRVRSALEASVADRNIDVVCATTTLAEGVNFPFATVIVETLVGHGYQLSPRALWNVAGRAGRFGVDSEGHCILFRPTAWQSKLQNYTLADYLSSGIDSIPPVFSAFATGVNDIIQAIDTTDLSLEDLEAVQISSLKIDGKASARARRIRGLINVMRVGFAHAGTMNLLRLDDQDSAEFESDEFLASRQLNPDARQFVSRFAAQQKRVVCTAVVDDPELLNVAARVGWSLESQRALLTWLRTRKDWQLRQYGSLVIGGKILHPDRLSFLIGPLANAMSEFEGDKLGGFTAYLARGWFEGWPLQRIRAAQSKPPDYTRLVDLIYARIQYMLPWALFGCHELVQLEAQRRGITVGSSVADLSSLATEGVPSFDALHLVTACSIERVDATRLANAYQSKSPQTGIMQWLATSDWNELVSIVTSSDQRRIDPDLRSIVSALADRPNM